MAQDFTNVKAAFGKAVQDISERLLSLVRDCDEMAASYFAKGFNSGGANQIVQDDLTFGNGFLTPNVISLTIAQLQIASTAITSNGRDVLRAAVPNPLP